MNYRLTSRGFGVLAAGLALAACEPDIPPPFEITELGGIEALLYFDADEDQVFDPSDGDYALQGVGVRITVRGDTTQVIQSATTNAQGRFTIAGLPAGTHDAYIVAATVPDGVVLCANPVPVTVNPDETRFFRLEGRPGCLVLIAEAEAQPLGTEVVVRGVVTSFPGQIRGGYTHIEDRSGGIRIFDSSLQGQDIQIGDRIEVSGTLAAFGGDLQLTGVTLRALEEDFLPNPQPVEVTTGEIAAAAGDGTDPILGVLARVENVQLTSTFGEGDLNGRNAQINDGSGQALVRLESGVAEESQLNSLLTEGLCYNITGVLGKFSTSTRTDGQIFPRSLEDVQEVPCA